MLEVRVQKTIGDLGIAASLTAEEGVTVLFGPSGSGKSSILRMIAGLVTPDEGDISIAGSKVFDGSTNLPTRERGIGYVFQDGLLFPHMTVRQNLQFAAAPTEDINETADRMEIQQLMDRRPATLSGGETQRVAIARALLGRPRGLLMDEPLASLDQARKDTILPVLKRLRQIAPIPIIYVTHSIEEAFRLADRIVLIENGKTGLSGTPAEVFGSIPDGTHRNPLAGGLLTGRLARHLPDEHLSELEIAGSSVFVAQTDHAPGSAVRIRLAASEISIATDPPEGISILNRLPVRVSRLTRTDGHGVGVTLELSDGQMLVASVTNRARTRLDLMEGKDVHALFKTVSVTPDDLD